jgi:hypothetical protein
MCEIYIDEYDYMFEDCPTRIEAESKEKQDA